jgi:hypothetical protein
MTDKKTPSTRGRRERYDPIARLIQDPHWLTRAQPSAAKLREARDYWARALAHPVAGQELGFPREWLAGNQRTEILRDAERVWQAMHAVLDQRGQPAPSYFRDMAMLHQLLGQEGFNSSPASYQPNPGRMINGVMQIGVPTFYQALIARQPPNDLVTLTNQILRQLPPDYFNNLPEGHPLRGQREVDLGSIWSVYNSLPVQMAAAYLNIQPALDRIQRLTINGQPLTDQQRRALAYICHNVPEIGERMINHIGSRNPELLTASIAGATPAEQRRFQLFRQHNPSIYGEGRSQETLTFLNQFAAVLEDRGRLRTGAPGGRVLPQIPPLVHDPVARQHLDRLMEDLIKQGNPPAPPR